MNIKLRAWNELADGGEMVTEENSGLKSYQILERFNKVMVWTGRKTAQGTNIYEGDITNFGQVVFCPVAASFGFSDNGSNEESEMSWFSNDIDPNEVEIWGNIYEGDLLD